MMNEKKTGVYTNKEVDYTFNFYIDLTVSQKMKFVNSIVALVVDGNSYNSVIRDLVFDFYVVDIFTDVDVSDFKHSIRFLDDVEEFLHNTNIVDIVKENVSYILFDELNKAVDDSIEYLTGIHKNPLNYALTSLVNTLERKVNEIDLSSAMEMASKFSNMTEELTPDSILKAYMKSDIYNKNTVGISENLETDIK